MAISNTIGKKDNKIINRVFNFFNLYESRDQFHFVGGIITPIIIMAIHSYSGVELAGEYANWMLSIYLYYTIGLIMTGIAMKKNLVQFESDEIDYTSKYDILGELFMTPVFMFFATFTFYLAVLIVIGLPLIVFNWLFF